MRVLGNNLRRSQGFAPDPFPGLRPPGSFACWMPFHTTAQPSAATSPVISDLAISLYFCNIIAVIVSSAGDEPRVLYMLDKCTLPMPQPLSTLNSRDLICYIFLALCLLSSLFWGLYELREYLAFLMLSL